MQLFYQPLLAKGHYVLDAEESRHCVRVLRKKAGDTIHLVDGQGAFYEARIRQADVSACTFSVLSTHPEPDQGYRIHLAIAPTKNADRLEWFVEKAVEIGIDEISLLVCDNSERKKLKTDRLVRKAVSAMKQSVKATLPPIHEPVKYSQFLQRTPAEAHKFVAYVSDSDSPIPHLLRAAPRHQPYTVLVGPEGDFSPAEIEQAQRAGFQAISLGTARLRTETAGIIACHTLHLVNA